MSKFHTALLLAGAILGLVPRLKCAPTPDKNHPSYDYSKFDEVYDQRQNGTENYKVDVNGVVLVYAPPEALLSALLDPGLLDGEYAEIEEILKPQKPAKPEELPVVRPEEPSSSTTTSLPPNAEDNLVQGTEKGTTRIVKRRYRLPEFIRPFIHRRTNE